VRSLPKTDGDCLHTQQVRGIEMDNMWGDRPSLPSDYYYSKQRLDVWRQSPSVLGSERTGPDLTTIGARQPSEDWHLMHLYNPRLVVSESIMPSYSWLFKEVDSSAVTEKDVELSIPEEFFNKPGKKIIASQEALDLVAYLKSLKQTELQDGSIPEFIPALKEIQTGNMNNKTGLNGSRIYNTNCVACHQANGKGIPGAFPPLAGSGFVNDENPEMLIKIILQGYDARSEFGVMPPFADQLSNAEVAAVATHERSSWGNDAPAVTEEDVKQIRDYINNELNQ